MNETSPQLIHLQNNLDLTTWTVDRKESEWVSEWSSTQVSEWVSKRVGGLSEWVSKFMSEKAKW